MLDQIFQEPVPSDILWRDGESLLGALGGEVSEGKGSRVRICLNGMRAVFHRLHPQKDTDRGTVRSVRRSPRETGVK